MDDSHGCIVIGEQFGKLDGKAAVLSSKAGYDEFKAFTSSVDIFPINIVNA